MNEWLAMGGYGFFFWGSYGVTLALIVFELLALRAKKRRALEMARAEAEAESWQ